MQDLSVAMSGHATMVVWFLVHRSHQAIAIAFLPLLALHMCNDVI